MGMPKASTTSTGCGTSSGGAASSPTNGVIANAEATDLNRGLRRNNTVHGRRDERKLELERVNLPGDVDVLGVARAPAGHDRDVVEPVGPPSRLADPDLDFHQMAPVVPTPPKRSA